MSESLRVLIIEDSEDDALLLVRELQRGGYELTYERVDTPGGMSAALDKQTWGAVLVDYSMPQFSVAAALTMLKERELDLPFIIVSGAVGEEMAVEALHAGAHDFIAKGNLARLLPAVERELRETEVRRERRQAEEALRIKDSAIASSISAIALIDLEGNVTYVNPSFLRLWGYSDKEVLGRPIVDFWQSEDSASEVIGTLRQTGNQIGELAARRKDGTMFDVQLSVSMVTDESGKPVCMMASFVDITERKKLEKELVKAQKLESIGLLAGGIAHDFNNILQVVLSNLSLAKVYAQPEDKAFQKVAVAEKAALRAQDLTQQLLTFSRGGAPVKKTASISELIRDSGSFALRGSNVRCEFSVPDDLWGIEVDKGQISQVISNLIINAGDAMPDGGIIKVCAENTVVCEEDALPLQEGKYVKITVEDQGIGIPDQYLPKIFDPYFTTKQKGSGLGLATSYSIVKSHDGLLTVESELGVGATFYVYLPASARKPSKRKAAEEKPVVGKGKVLVMDDDEEIRDATGEMLSHIGYEVGYARDGAEAVEVYKKAIDSGEPFDAVMLDLTVVGGMGGKEAMGKLKEMSPAVKAIVSSGYSVHPLMADFKQWGFSEAISKPYEIAELSRVLRKVVAGVS
ncbi:MAG: response regulator [Dehalococcoidia bacterium]|nr:response regulator [Dehalococcoidia bacterium]